MTGPRILDLPTYQLGGNGALVPGQSKRVLAVYGPEGAPPEKVILSIDSIAAAPFPIGNDGRLQAHIRWGSASGDNDVVLDARKGVRLTLEGSIFTVDLVYGGIVGPEIRSVVSIGYGSVGQCLPTFTEDARTLAAGASSAIFPVPQWSTSVAVLSDSDPIAFPAPVGTVSFFADAAGAFLLSRELVKSTFDPILPNAEFALVTNILPIPQVLTPIFRLGL